MSFSKMKIIIKKKKTENLDNNGYLTYDPTNFDEDIVEYLNKKKKINFYLISKLPVLKLNVKTVKEPKKKTKKTFKNLLKKTKTKENIKKNLINIVRKTQTDTEHHINDSDIDSIIDDQDIESSIIDDDDIDDIDDKDIDYHSIDGHDIDDHDIDGHDIDDHDIDDHDIDDHDIDDSIDKDSLLQDNVGGNCVYYDYNKNLIYNEKYIVIGTITEEGEIYIDDKFKTKYKSLES